MLPYTYQSIDREVEVEVYWDCVFKTDFGPFLGGEHVGCIELNAPRATMTEFVDGVKRREVKIKYGVDNG